MDMHGVMSCGRLFAIGRFDASTGSDEAVEEAQHLKHRYVPAS